MHICLSPSTRLRPRSTSSEHVARGSAGIKSKGNRAIAALSGNLSTRSLPKVTLQTLLAQFSKDLSLGYCVWSWARAARHQPRRNKPAVAPAVPGFERPRVSKPSPRDSRNIWLNRGKFYAHTSLLPSKHPPSSGLEPTGQCSSPVTPLFALSLNV